MPANARGPRTYSRRPSLSTPRLLASMLGFLLAAGCGARRAAAPPPTVRRIEVQEDRRVARFLRGTSSYNLRTAMEHPQAPPGAAWLAWAGLERPALDEGLLLEDALRLETWYAHHGWFDAAFEGWVIRTRRAARLGRGPVVDVVGRVHEGPRSAVRSQVFEGIDGLGRPVQARLRRNAPLRVGDPFVLDAYEATEDAIRRTLGDLSFAAVEVEGQATVHPEQQAVDVRWRIDPGPACVFGEVRIEGLDRVPEDRVRDELAVEPGAAFSHRALSRTRLRLYSLGTFSLVEVAPLPPGPDHVVPVRISLTEARFQQVRAGVGVAFQAGEQQVRASTRYTHTNLFGRLWNLQLDALAGWTAFAERTTDLLVGSEALGNDGPFAEAEGRLLVPRAFGRRRLRMDHGLLFERGREPAATFWRLEGTPALTWRVAPRLSLTLGWRAAWWRGDLADVLAELDPQATDAYTLMVLEQGLLWERRDDPIRTRRGWYARVDLAEAGLPSGYRFLRARTDLRRFVSVPRWRTVLAARLGAGIASPWGDAGDGLSDVPYGERFFLGGSNTVRGWGANRLGPLACDDAGDCLPSGARVVAWTSLEARVDLARDLGFAAFLDGGAAWADLASVDPAAFMPSVGAGLRYDTPIGPLRLDAAVRLRPDVEPWADEPLGAVHFALSEAF